MLLFLFFLYILSKTENELLRYIILFAIIIQIIFEINKLVSMCNCHVNHKKDDVVTVVITVNPNSAVLAWTHKPIRIYNPTINDIHTTSIFTKSNDIGELSIDIYESEMISLNPENRKIYYRYVNYDNTLSDVNFAYIYDYNDIVDDSYIYNYDDINNSIKDSNITTTINNKSKIETQRIGNVVYDRSMSDNYSLVDEFSETCRNTNFNKKNLNAVLSINKKEYGSIKN